MKELFDYLRLLYRNWILLITVPLATVIIAFFIIRKLPDAYTAHARMATGIVDRDDQLLPDGAGVDFSAISQEFDNLIQLTRLKHVMNQVSYRLILHDLTTEKPFREPSAMLRKMEQSEIDSAIALFNRKHKNHEDLSAWNRQEKKFRELLVSMRYDERSLSKKLSVYRVGNSDFIDIEFTAEDPDLAAFVTNTLTGEFIQYYSARVRESNTKTVRFLDSLLQQKQRTLNAKMETLKTYKIRNRVLNLNEQAKALYGQMADFETRREVALQEIVSYNAALKNIDSKFQPSDRRYMESALTSINQDIVALREQLKTVNEAYIKANFAPQYKMRLDSLRQELTVRIEEAGDKYIYNPLAAKENLVLRKLTMEISLELARNSVQSIDEELERLNRKFDSLVPHEAEIQAYESGIDIAGREYMEILQKYNQASLASGIPLQLRLIEQAEPGTLQSSRKLLLVIFSGILSFVLCAGALFLRYLLDNKVRDAETLTYVTGLPVLGTLPHMGSGNDIGALWTGNHRKTHQFRDLLRAIRFDLENASLPGKTVLITSLHAGVGKSFFARSLACAFLAANKKVLLIDADYQQTDTVYAGDQPGYLEDFIAGAPLPAPGPNGLVLLLNRTPDISLPEIADAETIARRLATLQAQFDLVLVETASLEAEANAREWIARADKVIAVYKSGDSIEEEHGKFVQYLQSLGPACQGWILNA